MLELTRAQKNYLTSLRNLHPDDLRKKLKKLNNKLVSTYLLTQEHEILWWKRDMIINLLTKYASKNYVQYVHHHKYEIDN